MILPVSDFHNLFFFSDTAYTERYIGLYKDHKDAYEVKNSMAFKVICAIPLLFSSQFK